MMNPEYAPPWQQLTALVSAEPPLAGPEGCRHCRTALPRFVSDELAGRPVDRLYPSVASHLDVCSRCRAEYEMLSLLMDTAADDSEVSL
jgi:hypothetical protein